MMVNLQRVAKLKLWNVFNPLILKEELFMNLIDKLIKAENGVVSWISSKDLVTRLILTCVLAMPLIVLDTALALFTVIITDDVSC